MHEDVQNFRMLLRVLTALHHSPDRGLFVSSTAKVGKTSLIMSLVSEEFPDEVRQPPATSILVSMVGRKT